MLLSPAPPHLLEPSTTTYATPTDYYQRLLLRWLQHPHHRPSPHEAALVRSTLAARLHRWTAARQSAEAAITLLEAVREADEQLLCRQAVKAHGLLGDACLMGDYRCADDAGGGGGGCKAGGAGSVDAAAAAQAYRVALDLLPLVAPAAAPATKPAATSSSSSTGGSSSGGDESAAFIKWASAARRRLNPRLAAARSRVTELDVAAAWWTDSAAGDYEMKPQQLSPPDGSSGSSSSPSTTALAPAVPHQSALTAPAQQSTHQQLALPLPLPYSQYRLVTAAGQPVERPNKHPFCMSRVHYKTSGGGSTAGGMGSGSTAVWYEHADGSCRWRQSASEVELMVLRVPPALPSIQLAVVIAPYALRVTNRVTGCVYLQEELERGVVAGECVWTYGGGVGEEGCVMTLTKMNLELFER